MVESPIIVPDLGEQIARVRVVTWCKPVGARVELDEVVVGISTEKIDVDLTSPIAGTLARIDVAEGEWVSVGTVLGVVTPNA